MLCHTGWSLSELLKGDREPSREPFADDCVPVEGHRPQCGCKHRSFRNCFHVTRFKVIKPFREAFADRSVEKDMLFCEGNYCAACGKPLVITSSSAQFCLCVNTVMCVKLPKTKALGQACRNLGRSDCQ